jgi:hypothetical protein
MKDFTSDIVLSVMVPVPAEKNFQSQKQITQIYGAVSYSISTEWK